MILIVSEAWPLLEQFAVHYVNVHTLVIEHITDMELNDAKICMQLMKSLQQAVARAMPGSINRTIVKHTIR